jgi:capsular polysaccharide biosynthesis protein
MNIKPLSQSEGPQSISALPAWFARIDMLQSLRLHKMLATLVALGTLGLGFAMLARQHSTFKATSVVYVSPNFPATLVTNQEQEYHYDSYIEEQLHLVKRYAVISGAVRKLKPGVWQHPGETLESAVERLQNSLTVKRDGQSYQLDITLQGGNPQYLAAIVNAVTDSYLYEVKDEEFYGRDERLDSLRQARLEVQAELTSRLQQQTQSIRKWRNCRPTSWQPTSSALKPRQSLTLWRTVAELYQAQPLTPRLRRLSLRIRVCWHSSHP